MREDSDESSAEQTADVAGAAERASSGSAAVVFVVADPDERDDGYVGERLRALGYRTVWLDRSRLPGFAGLDPGVLLLLLGSDRSAHEPSEAEIVEAESALVLDALDAGVPVLAICYGAQLCARALGGTSYRADDPEIGWRRIETDDAVLAPEGPWAQFHQDVFIPPPTSRVLATSWSGPQCIVDETRPARLLAWQFHPEVTGENFSRWVDEAESLVRRSGQRPEELKRQAMADGWRRRERAHALVDAALEYLAVAPAGSGVVTS